jgi:hypothetical protein
MNLINLNPFVISFGYVPNGCQTETSGIVEIMILKQRPVDNGAEGELQTSNEDVFLLSVFTCNELTPVVTD